MTGSTGFIPGRSLDEVIAEQLSYRWDGQYEFVCRRCRNWRGGVNCTRGCFIAAEGANTNRCTSFVEERRQR